MSLFPGFALMCWLVRVPGTLHSHFISGQKGLPKCFVKALQMQKPAYNPNTFINENRDQWENSEQLKVAQAEILWSGRKCIYCISGQNVL